MPKLNRPTHGTVAYTFLSVREKIHQFLSSIKQIHTKENWFPFFSLAAYVQISGRRETPELTTGRVDNFVYTTGRVTYAMGRIGSGRVGSGPEKSDRWSTL